MMNKQQNTKTLFHFMLRAQQIAQQEQESDKGYAMMMTSLLSIVMFSLLAAYMTMTNLSKSSTAAYLNGNNTFYAAESGLNRRAQSVREIFVGYTRPTGTSPDDRMQSCLTGSLATQGTGNFACTNYSFTSSSPNGKVSVRSTAGGVVTSDQDDSTQYISSTFVTENPQNIPAASYPQISVIPQGDLFGGMSMQQYTYQVSSTARTINAINSNNSDRTVLQMNFKARLVPLFQFAAFYDGDLEILPGPAMTLSGPVHSNGSLYLGGNNSLTIQGNVSSVGSIYSKRKNDNSTYADNVVKIATSALGVLPITTTSLLAANSHTATTNALLPANLTTTFGNKVKSGIDRITVPAVGFLGKTDAQQVDGIGSYYGKADLRIEYQPNKLIPLTVTTIKTGVAGADSSTCTGFDISSNRNERGQLVCARLSNAQLLSLGQPVLVKALNANERAIAPTGQTFAATPLAADIASAIAFQKLIAKSVAISGGAGILDFSRITTPLTATSLPGISAAEMTPFVGSNPRQIANKAGYFYLPAPIQIYTTFRNNRENRNISMLQTNLKSLAFWNRDNIVVDAGGVDLSAPDVLFKRHDPTIATVPPSKYATVCNGGAADPRSKSLQCLGLAANDTSEGGMVIHATVDSSVFEAPFAATTYPAGQSPYGFAFVGGSNLPGAVTIASDQAVYVQGDYNYYDSTNTTNPNNTVVTHPYNMSNNVPSDSGLKEPAAILADSLNVLSNQCNLPTNISNRLTCGIAGNKPAAIATSMNVAFLTGTDVTIGGTYNGGLENYPRFHESWSGDTLLYRGSFISLGTAQNVSGTWGSQIYDPPNRDWNYDLAFNNAANLPPLTPRLVYIRQDVFGRNH
jgi:hypothetical protein